VKGLNMGQKNTEKESLVKRGLNYLYLLQLVVVLIFLGVLALSAWRVTLLIAISLLAIPLLIVGVKRMMRWARNGLTVRSEKTLSFGIRYSLDRLGDPEISLGGGLLMVEENYAVIDGFSFNRDNIRWLGNRRGQEKIILDIDKDGWWYTLTIQDNHYAKEILEALQTIAPDNINTARYRRRPNVRSDFVDAFVTTQNLQGIWDKYEIVQLVITPLWFVAFYEGRVLQEVHIDTIEDIHCIKHPTALEDEALLLTFSTQKDEPYAYQITDADFAKRLEDATREVLDSSPLRKKKAQN
jgi:hypothetical protein